MRAGREIFLLNMASSFAQSLRFLIRHPRKAFALPWNRLVAAVGLNGLGVIQRPSPGHDPELTRGIARITSAQANAVSLAACVAARPRVSIIIPIYGQLDITRRCLASIQANPSECELEVIVIDDCSPDDSAAQLGSIPGVRLIRNPRNLGFLRSCNEAARYALGEYLCFLNNDTEVQPRWLDALLLTFVGFPGCGLAGSKLISCDGTLQEAGGIVWQDGSAWNFGRGQDPGHCTYNYAREVDYCSGASIMIPARLFHEVGGFDERYAPAYYEDTDIALRLRQLGHRVIYQPASEVLHLEGATCGRDTASGVKSYQAVNMTKFVARWQATLASHELPGQFVDNAKDRGHRGRVLVIDHLIPMPDRDSGSVDAYNMMLVLRDFGYQVTFASDDSLTFRPKYTRALQRVGVEVLHRPYVSTIKDHVAEHGARYDLVILMRASVMRSHIDDIRSHCPSAKIIFHTVDLHFLRFERQARLEQSESVGRQAESARALELSLIDRADIATVVGSQELELLRDTHQKQNVRLLPYSRHNRGTLIPFERRSDIVFVGGFNHAPNIDAVRWLVKEIMPIVWKASPEIALHVVGPDAPDAFAKLAGPRVIFHGHIADLDAFLDERRISLAPLRYGAGIKGKIGHAMSIGLPSVATNLAVEGMSIGGGDGVLVADSPEEIAATILRLHGDGDLWQRLSLAAVAKADALWGVEASQSRLRSLLAELSLDVPASPRMPKLYTNPL